MHKSPEVEKAAKRTERRTGEALPQDTDTRIQNYLDRFKEIIERENPDEKERLMNKLKAILYDKYVIEPEEIPEGYFQHQQELAREQGHGDVEITDEAKDQLTEVIVADQESTLDNWTDYLSGKDATYPDWLKYWSFRSVLSMGGYDKEKHAFSKRSKGTTNPFPDLDREALAYVLDAVEKKYQGKSIDSLEGAEKEEFQKLLNSENFAKLYSWAIEKVTPASKEQITNIDGKWVKYPKGIDPTTYIPEGFDRSLVPSLQGHGTGWCTVGESTAKIQLEGGDFYVYYSHDQEGKSIIPRAAIRMEGERIGEVRGIAPEQNLDPYITDVVGKKLEEFPDGEAYEKRNADMKQLTLIGRKVKAGEELDKDDLMFLYEINSTIEGFGYKRDPRIEELRSQRNSKEDAAVVFECAPEDIAWSQDEITENTKAYVGPLFPGIFTKFSHLEHIYTSFPEGKISRSELEIGGKSAKKLESELETRKINISNSAKDMLYSSDFTTLPRPEKINLVRLKARDLDFPNGATTDQIYAHVEELGLELCPAEVGPHQRLKDTDQPMNEWYWIVMKQIAGRLGSPDVFDLEHSADGLWLSSGWTDPSFRWDSGRELMFRLRKVSQES